MASHKSEDVLVAIALVQDYLRKEYIVDECREEPAEGCVSCEAVELERRLDEFAKMIVA